MGLNEFFRHWAEAATPEEVQEALQALFTLTVRVVAHPLQPLDEEILRAEFGAIKVERSAFVKPDEIWIVVPGWDPEKRKI
jgi:hypothetical protein